MVLLLAGCTINKDYDMDDSVSNEIIIAKDLTIPIGSLGAIPAESIAVLAGLDYITIEGGDVYLDFTSDPELEVAFDIKNIKQMASVQTSAPMHFFLEMHVDNPTPFNYELAAVVIDSTGVVVSDYKAYVVGNIAPGTPEHPSNSYVVLNLESEKIEPFDGIHLEMSFRGGEYAGKKYKLSLKDEMRFYDLKLRLPDGIPLSPEWLEDIKAYWSFFNIFFKKH